MSKAVELAVNQLFSPNSKKKEYMAKARQMMFNLRENESLRLQVANGIIEPRGLVRMSIEDLAGSQQQVQRKMKKLENWCFVIFVCFCFKGCEREGSEGES